MGKSPPELIFVAFSYFKKLWLCLIFFYRHKFERDPTLLMIMIHNQLVYISSFCTPITLALD